MGEGFPRRSDKRILIVDDDWMARELLQTVLVAAGYEVVLANSGEKAIELARRDPPHLVLLDVRLTGLDGFEVCRILKEDPLTRETQVVMITALETEEDRVQAAAAGAVGFMAKPFHFPDLLAQIKILLRET